MSAPLNWNDPATRRMYQQRYRSGTTNRQCDCGRPAVKYKSNQFVCARCDEIEQRMYSRPNSQAAYVERRQVLKR